MARSVPLSLIGLAVLAAVLLPVCLRVVLSGMHPSKEPLYLVSFRDNATDLDVDGFSQWLATGDRGAVVSRYHIGLFRMVTANLSSKAVAQVTEFAGRSEFNIALVEQDQIVGIPESTDA